MQVKKIAATALVGGGMTALAVAGMGTASADRYNPPAPTPSNTSCSVIAKCVTKTTTKTATTGNINVGNIGQNGGILNGNISNPQLGLGNTATSGDVSQSNTTKQGKQLILFGIPVQSSKTSQTGASTASNDNFSNNSSSVNTATSKNNSVNVN